MKKAFVTGAAGFLGSHFVEALKDKDYEITGLVMPHEDKSFLEQFNVCIVEGDMNDVGGFAGKIPKGAVVFHCAAVTPGMNASKEDYMKTNAYRTLDLFHACEKRNASKFVFISSSRAMIKGGKRWKSSKIKTKMYPYSHYGTSKLKAEMLLKDASKKSRLPILIIRPGGMYGPRMSPLSGYWKVFRNASKPIIPAIRKKGLLYQITFVENVVKGTMLAESKVRKRYASYIIADPPEQSFEDVIRLIKNELNPKARVLAFPPYAARIVGAVGRAIRSVTGKKVVPDLHDVANVLDATYDNPKKAIKDFGYKPAYPMKQGIKITADWIKENGKRK